MITRNPHNSTGAINRHISTEFYSIPTSLEYLGYSAITTSLLLFLGYEHGIVTKPTNGKNFLH